MPPEISSLEFVRDILDAVPTSANVRHYAKIVQEKSMLRKLIKVNEEIANTCYRREGANWRIFSRRRRKRSLTFSSTGAPAILCRSSRSS